MKKPLSKILIFALVGIFGLSLAIFGLAPTTHAVIEDICKGEESQYSPEVWEAAGCKATTKEELPVTITGILNVIISSSGIVTVVFIIIGGINMMTADGDMSKIEKAKATIIRSVIGLVICVLSFAIVNWTIGATEGKSSETAADPTSYTTKSTCEKAKHHWDNRTKKCEQ